MGNFSIGLRGDEVQINFGDDLVTVVREAEEQADDDPVVCGHGVRAG